MSKRERRSGKSRGGRDRDNERSEGRGPRGERGSNEGRGSGGERGGRDGKPRRFGSHRGPGPEVQYRDQLATPKQREEITKAKLKTDQALKHWIEAAKVAQEKAQRNPPPANIPLMDRLDPWQREAYDALIAGEHVIVDAPTTAGKTRVVEAFFELNVDEPWFRAAYTTPVKSLSNDKLKEFSDTFGRANVGIATGDIKENLDAPIVVATLESYRNSLLGVEPDLGRSLVVFDEYHFMQDTSRGSAWEEAIILTPPSCQLLLLSASVENADEFCAWIETLTNRRCRLIRVTERPVPLVDLIFYQEQWLLADEIKHVMPKTVDKNAARFPLEHDEIGRRLSSIPALGLTPAILYAGRRLSCENLAMEMCRHVPAIGRDQAQEIHDFLKREAANPDEDPLKYFNPNLKRAILIHGIGYHHSGLAPQARRAVENLVKAGQLRFCVATMGLSIGINFSVRSAMISDYSRPGEMGFTTYSKSEVLQMLGRAGRRGRDLVGFSLWPSVASYLKFGGTRRENCESRLKNDPTTFLGLLGRGFKLRDIENFYEKSFLRFGDKSVTFNLVREQPIKKALGLERLECGSPAHAYAQYSMEDKASPCFSCSHREACHAIIESKMNNPLAHLHLHLHAIGCIDQDEQLTSFGSIARYFPQSGGLLVAFLIDRGDIDLPNLLAGLELMGSLCLSRFKDPRIPDDYEYPFEPDEVDQMLEDFYPVELFEELYDPPNQRRDVHVFREFNPAGGALVKEWAKGLTWPQMVKIAQDEKFGQGDLMALFYRAATYLNSLVQAKVPGLSPAAASLRDEILREPLTPAAKAIARVDDDDEDVEDEETDEEAVGTDETPS